MSFRRLTPLLLVASLALPAMAGAPPLDFRRLDRIFDAFETNQRLMGGVAIARDGEVIYSRSFGERAAGVPNDAATMFRVGSITKVFTAALIYQLIDEGKLTLSTPLSRFFPQIPNAPRITIAHLLAHCSGIPDRPNAADFADGWVNRPQTRADLLARIAAGKPEFEPGAKIAYSNPNYILLGFVVESVTGSTYARQLQARIARPLGLGRLRYGAAVRPDRNEALPFEFREDAWVESARQDLGVAGGAGAIVATPSDLARFASALFTGKVISAGSLSELLSPLSPELEQPRRKGIVVSTLRRGLDKEIYSHLGGIDAFSANLVYFPEERVAIAIALNGQNYPMGRLFWLLAVNAVAGPDTPLESSARQAAAPSFEPVELAGTLLDQYAGTYRFDQIDMNLIITRDGAQLRAQATGQDSFAIEALSESFFWDRSNIMIEFNRDDAGAVTSLTLFQGKSQMTFTPLR